MVDKNSQINNNIEEQKYWDQLEVWEDDGEEWSVTFGGTDKLWNDFIYPKISLYLKGDVLEIAPGHGRMSIKLIDYTSHLYLVDMNQSCISRCKERFVSKPNISYFINNGLSLECISDDSIDFVFSWDSFVHMQKFVIDNYLQEISKKLKVGGVGAIHHSCFWGGNDEYSFENVQGRSNFTPELFKSMCEEYGMEIVKQELFRFNNLDDGISIFKKKQGTVSKLKKRILLKITCVALGDTLCSTPTVRKVSQCYGSKVSVQTYQPDLFKNNPYVDGVYTFDDNIDENQFDETFETYNQWIKTNKELSDIEFDRKIEIKLSTFEARQIHAMGVGISLYPEDMHCDYIPEEQTKKSKKIDKNFLVFHVTESWPNRTWSTYNWQRLVDLVKGHTEFKIVLVGRSHKERVHLKDLDKRVVSLDNVDFDYCINDDSLSYQQNSNMNYDTISELWHIINNGFALVSFDSGPIHIAGTTDSHIVWMRASVRPEKTAPYRQGRQDYKFHIVGGKCEKYCSSEPMYSVKEWGTINSMPYYPECQEKYDEFYCHPTPEQVFFKICEIGRE